MKSVVAAGLIAALLPIANASMAAERRDGPLDCSGAKPENPICAAVLPADATPEFLTVRNEKGEKVERGFVRFGSSQARELGYREAVVILYDVTTNGQRRTYLSQTREAVNRVIDEALAEPSTAISVAAFDAELSYLSRSADAGAATASVNGAAFDGTTTLTYSAVIEAAQALSGEDATLKRIVLATDGIVEDTTRSVEDAIQSAKDAGVIVDTLGLFWAGDGSREVSNGREVLQRLTEGTGGAYGEVLLRSGLEGVSGFVSDLRSARRESGFVEIRGPFERAEVELIVQYGETSGVSAPRETEFRAGIDFDCAADQTLAACAADRAAANEEAETNTDADNSADPLGPRVDDDILGLGVPDWWVFSGAGALAVALAFALLLAVFRKKPVEDEGDDDSLDTEDPPALGAQTAGDDLPTPTVAGSGYSDDETRLSERPIGRLIAIGNEDARPFTVTKQRVGIGRSDENDLVLKHESISRHHAALHADLRDGGVNITDLDSLNHVYVNGEKVQTSKLSHNDILRLGDVELRFETS